MQPRTAPTLWYVVCGALLVVLLVLLGFAFWPRPASTAVPTPAPATTTLTPVQPSTPTPAPAPTPTPSPAPSPTPAQPTTTPPVPDNLPAPILDNWDRNADAWDGNPPPVVFKALFTNGDPGYLPTIGNYRLLRDRSFTSPGAIIATYAGQDPRDKWAITVETASLMYDKIVGKFEDLHATDFALCGQFVEGRPACMAAAEDSFMWITYEGAPDTKTYEEALQLLSAAIKHYSDN